MKRIADMSSEALAEIQELPFSSGGEEAKALPREPNHHPRGANVALFGR